MSMSTPQFPFTNKDVTTTLVKRYSTVYLIVLSIISLFEVFMIARGIFVFDFARIKHVLYFVSYIFLLTMSLGEVLIIFLNKKGKLKDSWLFYSMYAYCLAIVIWASLISILDSSGSDIPFVYFTIIITIAGLLFINPWYYISTVLASFTAVFLISNKDDLLSGLSGGDLINDIVFIVMCILVAVRQYKSTLKQEKYAWTLNELNYTDHLTGLGNERKYFEVIERINSGISKGRKKFAVTVIDVNGVKVTNDKYGHRFGCHLIVTTGNILPTIFKSSTLFHIGGDEFVGIIEGEDCAHLDARLSEFKEKLEYSDIEFEGKPLFLSAAIGIAKCEDESSYREVFQKADAAMYEDKKIVKETHNIPSR